MDRIDAMRAFVAVAAHESFAEGARQLRQSPSAVTRAIGQIEAELGILLFNRTTRIVRLTDRGRVHFESCRRILDDIAAADRLVRGEDAEPRGLIDIAAPVLFGRLHVLPITLALMARYPALEARLVLSDRNVHVVDDGFDLAVRIGALPDSSLMAVRLGSVCRTVVASPAYLAARGTPAAPADLARHDVIAFANLDAVDAWHFGAGNKPVRVFPRLTVNSAAAAIAAAEAGAGITHCLSYQVREAVRAGRLVLLLPGHMPPPAPVSVLFAANRHGAPNVAAFVAAARAHFAANPLLPPAEW